MRLFVSTSSDYLLPLEVRSSRFWRDPQGSIMKRCRWFAVAPTAPFFLQQNIFFAFLVEYDRAVPQRSQRKPNV